MASMVWRMVVVGATQRCSGTLIMARWTHPHDRQSPPHPQTIRAWSERPQPAPAAPVPAALAHHHLPPEPQEGVRHGLEVLPGHGLRDPVLPRLELDAHLAP